MKIIGVFRIRLLAIALLALLALFISSCDTSGKANPITITISPTTITVSIAGTEQFTATVVGSANTAVTWSASGGTIDNNGLFTAGNTAGTFEVKAVSVADSTKFDIATVKISKNISISIKPDSATVFTNASKQFAATVVGKAVTWSATGGTIDNSGLFTAGNTVGDFEVKASSVADPSKFVTAAVKVIVEPIVVSISSAVKEFYISNEIQFKASVSGTANQGVSWSASSGSISSSGLYTAPSNVGSVIITAKWNADNSKTASITIQIKELKKARHEWLGSNKNDYAKAVATDAEGNVYLAGHTDGALFDETNQGGNRDAFIVKYDKTGTKVWHKWLGSNQSDNAIALATDKDGNVYLAGYTFGTLFDETNKGNYDAFIVKYDKEGTKLWHKWLGSNQSDNATALATDAEGNVYLAGYTFGTLFDETNKGEFDAFIVKYDKEGTKLWHKWLGSNQSDYATALATDAEGKVYLAGATDGALFDETNKGNYDAFIVKYDKEGTKVWHKWLGSNSFDEARALVTDKDGKVYLAGGTGGALFDETNQGDRDAFIVKYDKEGTKVWHKWLGSNSFDEARALATDKDSNVYLAGGTGGALFAEINQGNRDAFIVKYDKTGTKLWHKWLGTNQYDYTRALATDKDGNVYLAGSTYGALFAETNKGGRDAYIVKFKQ